MFVYIGEVREVPVYKPVSFWKVGGIVLLLLYIGGFFSGCYFI
jgi:hypothetical protein